MLKLIVALSFFFNLSSNVWASGTAKLVDYLISEAGVLEILATKGIKGKDASLVQSYVKIALKSLGAKKTITSKELNTIFQILPSNSSDSKIREELKILLSKSESDISKDDIVQAINKIIFLADRHGKSIAITCANCINETLTAHGFDFSIKKLKNSKVKDILESYIPKNADDYHNFITTHARNANMGDYTHVTPEEVAPIEEKAMATYFGILELGTPNQKKLAETIKKLSTKDGKTNLFDPKNKHKFWKIFADEGDEMSEKDIKGWTETLNEVAVLAEKEDMNIEEAFYKTLKQKADGNEKLMSQLEILKKKRCFFK